MDWSNYSLEKPKQTTSKRFGVMETLKRPVGSYAPRVICAGEAWSPHQLEPYTPQWTNRTIFSEMEDIKGQLDKTNEIITTHERTIASLVHGTRTMEIEILKLKRELLEISSLKETINRKPHMDILWEISNKNAKILEEIFNLDEIVIDHPESALSELRGILKDCKEEGINSDTIVHSVREG